MMENIEMESVEPLAAQLPVMCMERWRTTSAEVGESFAFRDSEYLGSSHTARAALSAWQGRGQRDRSASKAYGRDHPRRMQTMSRPGSELYEEYKELRERLRENLKE